jgi:TPR repeat protein
MLAFYGILVAYSENESHYTSFSNAVMEQQKGIAQVSNVGIVRIALEISAFKAGFQVWMVQHFGEFGELWPRLLAIFGGVVVFFNATATLSSFVIHRYEYRRIFGPITDDDVPPPLLRKTIALSSAVITFLLLFVCLPSVSTLEKTIRQHSEIWEVIKDGQKQIIAMVERIDGVFYKLGTIDKVEVINSIALGKIDVSKAVMEGRVDNVFNSMEANVDAYLDWYYSLGAEYMRLVKLSTGAIESDMRTELETRLNKGDLLQKFSDGVSKLLVTNKIIDEKRRSAVQKILDENRLPDVSPSASVKKSMALKDMFSMPSYILGANDFNNRLVAGGVVATGVGAAITTKVMSKGVFKVAAKAVTKVAIKKATATGIGLMAGGLVGSVVPVFGTAAGGVAGAIIAGVIFDKALLELEELADRKRFEKEIIEGIRETKEEFKKKLLGNVLLFSQEDKDLQLDAEKGDAKAQFKLAVKYADGVGFEKSNEKALSWYHKSADQGDSDAQANLGVMYQNGTGVDKSNEQAVFWYRKSADQGNASGENLLGVMSVIEAYPKIKEAETKKDDKEVAAKLREEADLLFKEAVSWFRKSADQGNSQAQLNLGVMYQKGFGTEENNEQAVSWFRKSAEQGNSDAQLNLGAMYQYGDGVDKSNEQAVSWYRKSADQDNRDAQVSLGVMYQNGDGVEQSNDNALFWYQKSTVINSKSNVHLFDTHAYKPNFSGLSSLKGVDEYVIATLTNKENFQQEAFDTVLDVDVDHAWVDVSLEAHFKYHVALSTLKYNMDEDTLVFTVPKLNLSLPVATESSTYKYRCKQKIGPLVKTGSSFEMPVCKRAQTKLIVEMSNDLQKKGEAWKVVSYKAAAKSLADNFNEFAKNNDKEIFYKNIAVVFADEPHQPRRVFNYNKNYCGKELCKEVLLGNGRILTVH